MYRLIIVEDDYQIRTGLSKYFPWADIGFQLVDCFENGKQALSFVDTNPVDVILSDIKMPVMTGLELAKELNSRNSKILIVFLSAYKDFDYAQQALNFGAKNYIVKSTKYDDLVAVFHKLKNELDEKHVPESKAASPSIGIYDNKKINKIRAYIEAHSPDSTLQNVAGEVNMNPIYLSRFFKEKTGINFNNYVTEVKMKKAAELLKQDYKLYQISEMVGYSNAKNFARAFKKYFKSSPQQFRDAEQ
jgi:two-component system response regulator YesN